MSEFEFSSDAVKVSYAQDKVDQYGAMTQQPENQGYHWERTDPNGSKLTNDIKPQELARIASNAAFHLSRELNSIGVIYSKKRDETY